MEKKKIGFMGRLGGFLKRNIYYVMLFMCIAAVGTLVSITLINEAQPVIIINDDLNDDPVDDPIDDPVDDPIDDPVDDSVSTTIVFSLPLSNGVILQDFSDSILVFSSTLNQYGTHLGIDYGATEGTEVVTSYRGTVERVTNDILNGITVVINHGNGIMTVYSNLASASVVEGQDLVTGAAIGTVGNSGILEYEMGAHLHYEVLADGVSVDPYIYLESGSK